MTPERPTLQQLEEDTRHLREHRPIEEPGAVEEYLHFSDIKRLHLAQVAFLAAEMGGGEQDAYDKC